MTEQKKEKKEEVCFRKKKVTRH